MRYTHKQKSAILQKIIDKISKEIFHTTEDSEIDAIMNKYGVTLEESAMPINKNTSTILVLGALKGRKSDYQMTARKLNIPENNIEFVDDYSKMHSFNAEQLRYSDRYSDIIVGPTPHSIKNKGDFIKNKGDFSSIIAMIENNPKEYPKLLKAIANNSLKITTSNFKELLQQTRYYQEAI